MKDRVLLIEGEEIPLTAVAENDGNVLYSFETDYRVVGAPLSEIKRMFPDFKKTPEDSIFRDFLIEENGTLILYDPDGEPVDQFELYTHEDINKVD